jgi:hypothetical protein
MADHDNLRYILDLARACVYKGEAPQALAHLKSIQPEIEDLVGSSFWAEHELIYAGALAGMNKVDAETAFEDTLKRCADLSQPDPVLMMIAHEDYARYLAGRHAIKRSREQYRKAEKIAESLGRDESLAHFEMCLIKLNLEEIKDPKLCAFQRLQEAAKDGYTEGQQLEAWFQYTEEIEGSGPYLVATRAGAEASADYFRGALSAIQRKRK